MKLKQWKVRLAMATIMTKFESSRIADVLFRGDVRNRNETLGCWSFDSFFQDDCHCPDYSTQLSIVKYARSSLKDQDTKVKGRYTSRKWFGRLSSFDPFRSHSDPINIEEVVPPTSGSDPSKLRCLLKPTFMDLCEISFPPTCGCRRQSWNCHGQRHGQLFRFYRKGCLGFRYRLCIFYDAK